MVDQQISQNLYLEALFLLFQYLSSPESQTLRADLIRYIVGVVHPSNEVLCSDIIPRWAIIGWLLTSCQVSDSKLLCREWVLIKLFLGWEFQRIMHKLYIFLYQYFWCPPSVWFLFQTVVSTANAKLALFYDWLFYQPDKDNIMNIGESFYNYYNYFCYPSLASALAICGIIFARNNRI